MMRNLGFCRLLPHLIDVDSIKDLWKYSHELCWRVDLSYKIFSLEIYFPISLVECIASLPQPLDSETPKCANPSATLAVWNISILRLPKCCFNHVPRCEALENSNFLKKGKMVISVKIRNFSRSRMTTRDISLSSSREI